MEPDVGHLLEMAAGDCAGDPNVAEAWRQGRNQRRRRRVLKGFLPIGAVILAALFSPIRLASGAATLSGSFPGWSVYSNPTQGFSISVPPNWNMTTTPLTPQLADPRELVSLGTYPLLPSLVNGSCVSIPGDALNRLGASGSFVTVLEDYPLSNIPPNDFPERPAHFGADSGLPLASTEIATCLLHRFSGTGRFISFSEAGREFYAIVAVGPKASAAQRAKTFQVLDSLRVEPIHK